jgi:hypothetical protein
MAEFDNAHFDSFVVSFKDIDTNSIMQLHTSLTIRDPTMNSLVAIASTINTETSDACKNVLRKTCR